MRMTGILSALLAAGVLVLAPGFDGARADPYHRAGQSHQQMYNGKGYGYGWMGRQYWGARRDGGNAYGQRTHGYYGGLSRNDREKLFRIRQRFDNEWAFRRHLRNHKPELFKRYMQQSGHPWQVSKHQRPQRYVWYRGQTRQLR